MGIRVYYRFYSRVLAREYSVFGKVQAEVFYILGT